MEMLMWECLRVYHVLQRVCRPFLPDALAKECIYLGVTPPIKFNCFPGGSCGRNLIHSMKGGSYLRVCGKGIANARENSH